MKATTFKDFAHARIYSTWLDLPTWKALSPNARALLVEMLARYRPGENGRIQWPVRQVAKILHVSKSTAGTALIELERNGWLQVEKVAGFGGAATPATYRLTMFRCELTGQPATKEFHFLPGEMTRTQRSTAHCKQGHNNGFRVPVAGLNGTVGGTPQSRERDARARENGRITKVDRFRNPSSLNGLSNAVPDLSEQLKNGTDPAIDIIASPSLAASLKRMRRS